MTNYLNNALHPMSFARTDPHKFSSMITLKAALRVYKLNLDSQL